jgi:hypothetical protein
MAKNSNSKKKKLLAKKLIFHVNPTGKASQRGPIQLCVITLRKKLHINVELERRLDM